MPDVTYYQNIINYNYSKINNLTDRNEKLYVMISNCEIKIKKLKQQIEDHTTLQGELGDASSSLNNETINLPSMGSGGIIESWTSGVGTITSSVADIQGLIGEVMSASEEEVTNLTKKLTAEEKHKIHYEDEVKENNSTISHLYSDIAYYQEIIASINNFG